MNGASINPKFIRWNVKLQQIFQDEKIPFSSSVELSCILKTDNVYKQSNIVSKNVDLLHGILEL